MSGLTDFQEQVARGGRTAAKAGTVCCTVVASAWPRSVLTKARTNEDRPQGRR